MSVSTQRLGAVSTITMGTSPKGSTYNVSGEGLPLLNGPTEFGPDHPACTVYTTDPKRESEPNDLIFCVRGSTTGRMNWADQKYALGRGVCSFRGRSKEDTRFIRYALEVHLKRLLQFAGGATFPNLTKDALHDFPIPFPNNRGKIVDVLSAYDDLIENNRQRIQLLEQAARLLYKEWFVHLRFPGHEHVTITDGVPEGWEKKPLFDIASPTYGFAFKSKLFNTDGEGVPVARIRNIPSGESQTYTTEEAPDEKLLEDGEFVIGMDGDFHMNFWTGGKTWINQRVVRIKGAEDVSDAFLRYACEKPIQDFNATIAGTTVAHLGAKHLKLIGLLIPSKGILCEAQDFFDLTFKDVVKNNIKQPN